MYSAKTKPDVEVHEQDSNVQYQDQDSDVLYQEHDADVQCQLVQTKTTTLTYSVKSKTDV